MDSQLRMRKHNAKRQQGGHPGVPSSAVQTTIEAVPTSADDDANSSSPTLSLDRDPSTTSADTPSTSSSRTRAPLPTSETPIFTTTADDPFTSSTTVIDTPSTSSTSTSTSSTSTSSSTPLTTTTILSTSTSSRLPTTSSTSTTAIPLTSSSISSTSRSLVTSFVTASAAVSSTLSATGRNSLSDDSSSSGSSGPSTGTVVGIVAGALVGVVVISGIVGYFFRTKCSNKDEGDYDGENPFGTIDNAYGANQTRSEMRRDSQMIMDDDASIHQMSELGGNHGGSGGGSGGWPMPAAAAMAGAGAAGAAAGAYGLNRANTQLSNPPPGIQRSDTVNPRPPTMIQRHYANLARNANNGPPAMPSFQPGQIVSPGQYYPSQQANQSGPYPSFPPTATGYSQQQQQQQGVGHSRGFSNEGYQQELPARSGTPEYQNPQQYFHQAQDSYSSAQNQQMNNPFEGGSSEVQREGGMDPQARAKRTLSVRNAGLDQGEAVRDSVYGGM